MSSIPTLTKTDLETLREVVQKEVAQRPPTIGLVGVSGVGKSSTINTLFKANLPTSPTVACTKAFQDVYVELVITEETAKGVPVSLRVIDAPGLGEDIARDPSYLEMYRKHLPACDVILWVMTARNRASALDQLYLREFEDLHDRLVFGVNQVDLLEPLNWNTRINLPSKEQRVNIEVVLCDRREKLQGIVKREVQIVAYSAKTRYHLQELFTTLIKSCSPERAWIFEGLKNFDHSDFLPAEVRAILANGTERSLLTRFYAAIRKAIGLTPRH